MFRFALLLSVPAMAGAFLFPAGGGCGCAPPPPPPCLPPLPPPPQICPPQLPPLPQISLPPPPRFCPPPIPQISLPPPPQISLPQLPSGCGCGRKKRAAHETPLTCSEIINVIEKELDNAESQQASVNIEQRLKTDFSTQSLTVHCAPSKGFSLIPLEGKRTCATGNAITTCVVFH